MDYTTSARATQAPGRRLATLCTADCCKDTRFLALRVGALHVALEDLEELRHDSVSAEGGEEGTILEYRGDRLLEGAGKADAEICVLRLPWAR